ncbi:tyrosinase cofactor [Streptomyces sp. NPDC101132]|uniref:apotyrosinase chaperone MelC1 n=1 Tax=Streptomyces sp. NPDC101132 TaxID=3366110 RepID=UPI0038265E1E
MSVMTRRRALGVTASAAAALAVAGATGAAAAGSADHADHTGHTAPGSFDEVYKGRRIQGGPTAHGGHHGDHGGGHSVRIDGQELHIMRNADGTWISVVNHYETYRDLRSLARAAVVELQGAKLVPLATA